ncbi:MAG: hypothetical protein JXA33_19715 [Anaerolineae bacterium]|nr:hypothetical protein [Anaerolineae bacterium]
MEEHYESYPAWIIAVCNLVSIAIYIVGACILAGFHIGVSLVYVLFCLWLEFRVLQKSCVNCYYYGKNCGMGKGRLCAILFKQGNPQSFAAQEATWKDILPDFLISLIPLAGGILLSFLNFTWFRVILIVLLVALAFVGTAAVRGNLLCKYCEQGRLGCPAAKLFEKATEEGSS